MNRYGPNSKVTIHVNNEKWLVPRGLGIAYKRAAKDPCEPGVLRDILELVGYTAEPTEIARWPLIKRVEAEIWAARTHLRASDNILHVPPLPSWFPKNPWQGGKPLGDTIFDSPLPTKIPNP